MNPQIDHYLAEGCGRCPLGGTPNCKVHRWEKELVRLREIILDCNLTEELKWSIPCYTYNKKNILVLAAFKEYCSVSFFKGALLKDAEGLLVRPGENTQAGRQFKFTNLKQIIKLESAIKAYIYEAIEVEKAGLKVREKKVEDLELPEELIKKFKAAPSLKKAFEKLTPGRQKGYILHFSQAKQSKTREARIEKCVPMILNGKGFFD